MVIEKLEKKVSEEEFQAILTSSANELGFEIKGEEIYKDNEKYRIEKIHENEKYRIEKIHENEHKYGEGGHKLNSIILFRANKQKGKDEKVLESRDYTSWMTLSDDSEDYPTKKDQFVALYLEDKLARAVFEKLKC